MSTSPQSGSKEAPTPAVSKPRWFRLFPRGFSVIFVVLTLIELLTDPVSPTRAIVCVVTGLVSLTCSALLLRRTWSADDPQQFLADRRLFLIAVLTYIVCDASLWNTWLDFAQPMSMSALMVSLSGYLDGRTPDANTTP